jgi:hypothetical protein
MSGLVYPESRGKREDASVADGYSRFRTLGFDWATPVEVQARLPGPIAFGRKESGCVGLVAADLSAYPVARYIIHPGRENRPFEVLKPKLYAGNRAALDYALDPETGAVEVGGSWFATYERYWRSVAQNGLKVFPQ